MLAPRLREKGNVRALTKYLWPNMDNNKRDQLKMIAWQRKQRGASPTPFPTQLTPGEVKAGLFGTPYHREAGIRLVLPPADYGDLVLANERQRDGKVRKQAMAMFVSDPRSLDALSVKQLRRMLRSTGVLPTTADREQLLFQLRRALSHSALGGGEVVLEETARARPRTEAPPPNPHSGALDAPWTPPRGPDTHQYDAPWTPPRGPDTHHYDAHPARHDEAASCPPAEPAARPRRRVMMVKRKRRSAAASDAAKPSADVEASPQPLDAASCTPSGPPPDAAGAPPAAASPAAGSPPPPDAAGLQDAEDSDSDPSAPTASPPASPNTATSRPTGLTSEELMAQLESIQPLEVPEFKDAAPLSEVPFRVVFAAMDGEAGRFVLQNKSPRIIKLGGCRLTCAFRARPGRQVAFGPEFWDLDTGGRWSQDAATAEYQFPAPTILPPHGILELICGPRPRASPDAFELPAPGGVQRIGWDVPANPLLHCWSVTISDETGGRHQTLTGAVLRDRMARVRREIAQRRRPKRSDRSPRPDAVLREMAEELRRCPPPDPMDDWEDLGQTEEERQAFLASRRAEDSEDSDPPLSTVGGPVALAARQQAQQRMLAKRRGPVVLTHPDAQPGQRTPTACPHYDRENPGLTITDSRNSFG